MTSCNRLIDGSAAETTRQDGVAADAGAAATTGSIATAATAVARHTDTLLMGPPRSVTGSASPPSMSPASGAADP
ncbi:hypothetical protein GCM10010168_51820 [Actinoplanes ianthinogenes]|uniref:Uncharacterized protein n=1 Tax=Actinoplanes ianthinogenes TaxID=122358 RepID=A0ABM7M3K5_9ACTN|nr:hypothetical protein Aiant_68900 [Actinoplanes ianthinogenes]GGR27230.1 hypothetical protein GCM10010168_51820 [Actinoplanes ianthinogenes]